MSWELSVFAAPTPPPPVDQMEKAWRDCSLGEWLHHCDDNAAGWEAFQAYRDRVLQG